jgi:SAM-dependent methyltransferase
MCDASFIPLEFLKGKIEIENLTQEDYIELRRQIAIEYSDIDGKITAVLDGQGDPKLAQKENFEDRLKNYANAQMEYIKEYYNKKSEFASKSLVKLKQERDRRELRRHEEPYRSLVKDRLSTIERYLSGYYAIWILDIGLKSDLFATIDETETATIEELSWRLDLAPFYVEAWCRAAYGLEILDLVELPGQQKKGYKLASGLKELLLDPTHPTSMRYDIAFSTMLHQDFLAFPNYLRTGAVWPLADRPEELHKLYVESTLDDYPVITDIILPFILGNEKVKELKESDNFSILDVGTGAGFALIHYAKTFSKAKVVGIDINSSRVDEAYNTIQAAVTSFDIQNHKIEVLCQDIKELEEPEDTEKYNLIICNLVLYQIRFSDYLKVFGCIQKALIPGGILVISEYHFPESDLEPIYRSPGYQSFLSNLLHFALTGATMVPIQKLVEMLEKEYNFEIISGKMEHGQTRKEDEIKPGDKALHHPLEERQIIVAKKPATPPAQT